MSKAANSGPTTETIPVYVVQRLNRSPSLGTREHGWPKHNPSQAGYETWLQTMEELEDEIDVREFGVGDRVATMQVHPETREVQGYTTVIGV
jgi:hypothetical protein